MAIDKQAAEIERLKAQVAGLEARLKSYHDDLHEDLRWRIHSLEQAQRRVYLHADLADRVDILKVQVKGIKDRLNRLIDNLIRHWREVK